MRIMGWDLSITCTGVAMPDGSTAVVKPRGKGYDRLLGIEERLCAAVRVARPDLAVIEDIRAGLKGDAAKVVPMVHAVAILALGRAGVPYVLVNASTLKLYATGYGAADKDSMALAALTYGGRTFPGDTGGDMCDAWWLRAAGYAAYGRPVVRVPQPHVDALRAVEWPRVGEISPLMELRRKRATARPGRRRKAAV
jgi:Holliday junction resolvasome RuvABC endonuclease subunit